jgi:hypothetical protein
LQLIASTEQIVDLNFKLIAVNEEKKSFPFREILISCISPAFTTFLLFTLLFGLKIVNKQLKGELIILPRRGKRDFVFNATV